MPYKDKDVKRAHDALYGRTYYQRHKDLVKARIASNKRLARDRWIEFKATQHCQHCGESHPAVIDFHHVVRDGTQKSVNRLAADNKWTRVYEEVKKCIPLCSNCHRKLHWNESRDKVITKDMTGTPEKKDDDDSSAT